MWWGGKEAVVGEKTGEGFRHGPPLAVGSHHAGFWVPQMHASL